jgi:hypothetical protein
MRHCAPGEEQIVRDVADWIVRLNIMKFDGMYNAYA